MTMIIRPLLFALSFSLFLSNGRAESLAAADPQPTAFLRGYGKVKAEFGAHRVLFECEDAEHADILLGKLLADLFWDAGPDHCEKKSKVRGQEILLHQWQPYGVISAAALEKHVMVVGAETEEALLELIAKEPSFLKPEARFKPAKPYPKFLDFYDLKAFKSYTHPMSSVHNEGLESHWPFVKKFGLGGLAFQMVGFWAQSPAPGVAEWTPADYEVFKAEKEDGLVVVCPSIGGEVPLWVHNRFPFTMMQPSPTALIGAWGGPATAGAHYESWWTPVEKRIRTCLAFERQIMERYRSSPSLGGWHICSGSPGGEFGFHERTGEFWDYSPTGQDGFRQWLREVKKLDLKKLGLRWHNNAEYFKSWAEVTPPDPNSFFGNLDAQAFLLGGNWKWVKAAKNVDQSPASTTDGWAPVDMPPSQQQDFLPWGATFYRKEFDAAEWLEKNKKRDIFLVCAVNVRSQEGTFIWLNGQSLGQHRSTQEGYGPFALQVTDLIKPGANELVLRVPAGGSPNSEGKIFGPVFLTTTEPSYYPHYDARRNARYADLKEWQAYSNAHIHLAMLELARAIDPDHPIILSGTAGETTDFVSEMAERYGAGVQMTGREGWYHPWWAGLGYVNGFYGTSEPSATPNTDFLSRMLGWIFVDGDSHHTLFWSLEDFILEEKKSGWFTKNRRLIQLFGKSLRAKPSIALFRSAYSLRLGSPLPWNWDIGRGELQSAHFDNVYATESEIEKGLLNGYPVLFDGGSEFMEPETVAALQRYVENGGTFVALHNTGLHTSLEPNSYPISKLTGFKVISAEKNGTIKFLNPLPIFKGWEGKEFEGEGSAVDYQNNQSGKGNGLALQKDAMEAEALAQWEDGSVAIGYRPLGKGRVIVIGSSFWRNGKDVAGKWQAQSDLERNFFERLFSDLGVQRNTEASQPDIWARKFITKNGLQEWLVAFNGGATETKADMAFRVEQPPSEVRDLIANKPVEFKYSPDGWIRIAEVAFPVNGIRIFGVKRASLVDGLPFWWSEKKFYWKRSDVPEGEKYLKTIMAATEPNTMAFEQWKFMADKTNTVGMGSEWLSVAFDDKGWRDLRTGPWNLLDDSLKDYQGVGLYRAKFIRPAAWKGRRVALGFYSYDKPIVCNEGSFYLNGKRITEYQSYNGNQTLAYDVTDQIQEGENELAVKVVGGKEFSGVTGAVWLEAERDLEPLMDLAGDWQEIKGNRLSTQRVTLPGRALGAYLVREIEIPSAWEGKNIFLRMQTPTQWVGSVVLNGHPISYNGSLHLFSSRTDVNLTPFVRPGRKNRLEIWPRSTVSTQYGPGDGIAEMFMTNIAIGCEANENSAATEPEISKKQ